MEVSKIQLSKTELSKIERCKDNINGHCKMFGRRESCEECSEYSVGEDRSEEEKKSEEDDEEYD
jgi:hypothetical protein